MNVINKGIECVPKTEFSSTLFESVFIVLRSPAFDFRDRLNTATSAALEFTGLWWEIRSLIITEALNSVYQSETKVNGLLLNEIFNLT